MKKTILIGFFLASITGYGNRIALTPNNGQAYWPLYMVPGSMRLVQVGAEQDPGNPDRNDRHLSTNYTVWWIALALILLAFPLYLFFLTRKRQEMSSQIALLRKDVTVLFDHAPCGYQAVGGDGRILQINSRMLQWLGYEKEEIVGRLKFADLVEGERIAAEEKVAALLQMETPENVSLKLITKSGTSLPVIIREVPMAGIERRSSSRLFSFIDNSDCHQAMERIKSLDHELESFSYSISHDLRAPLRSIDGYSKILHDDYGSQMDEEGRRVLNVVMSNAKRMGRLIDDLLEFGRLGRKTIQYARVNMMAMAKSIANDLKSEEPGRNINLKIGDLHTALADADMMRQVWFNLLDNAFKYSGKKEIATIEVRSYKAPDGQICYEVKDDGVGFDMKYAHKLFGVFQRLHKIQDFAGTGVGLAIVKRIVSRHGGRVGAEGSLESGAVFYFTIPDNENE